MNEKILWVDREKKYYSYADIYSYKNVEILGPVNDLIEKGDNVVHCMCHGKNKDKSVKMHTRRQDNKVYYSLASNRNSKRKHSYKCPKYNEEKTKRELMLKGRIYKPIDKELELPLRVPKNLNEYKKGIDKVNEKYSILYGIGEMLLCLSNNAYIDTHGKIGKENDVLSKLYRYYENGDTQKIDTYLSDVIVDKESCIKLGDIMFNPKWIKCDEATDKTSIVIKGFNEINKRNKSATEYISQYLLLKYKSYTAVDDNLVRIELYARGKNTKKNYDKSVFVYMNKFKFFSIFNMYKLLDATIKVDYYVSSLVIAKEGKLFIEDLAFIPVYPEYCLPIDTVDEIHVIAQLLKMRDRLCIKKIAKMDYSYNEIFKGVIPDFIVQLNGNDKPILIESFDLAIQEYFQKMITKTVKYEQLVSENKCEFLGFYRNLGWKNPPLSILLSPNFKTMDSLSKKVEASVDKMFE